MTRSKAILLSALLLVSAAVAFGSTASPANSASRKETQLVSLNSQIASAINAFRTSKGLAPLKVLPALNHSARQHSNEMGTKGYFDHPSADGTPFWKRIQRYYTSKGYSYWTVGENLLYSQDTISAADALKMWIASPDHLRNLKDPNFTDLGVSSVRVVNAGGVYGGDTVVIITTDFGARH